MKERVKEAKAQNKPNIVGPDIHLLVSFVDCNMNGETKKHLQAMEKESPMGIHKGGHLWFIRFGPVFGDHDYHGAGKI